MKYNILSSISLDYCKKELNEIKKSSNLNFLLNKKNIQKIKRCRYLYLLHAAIKVDKKFTHKKIEKLFLVHQLLII